MPTRMYGTGASGEGEGMRASRDDGNDARAETVDLREVVVEHHREIFRYAALVRPQQCRRRGSCADGSGAGAAAGRHRVGSRTRQEVCAPDRAQPRHRPGARAARACRWSRGPTSPMRSPSRRRPTRSPMTAPKASRHGRRSPTSPTSTARCCGCGSSRSSVTTRSRSAWTPPNTGRASASHRAMQALRGLIDARRYRAT